MKTLSDYQQSILLNAAQPLAPQQRPAFMMAVAERLESMVEIGDGTVSRVCREIQREYFDPPNLKQAHVPEQRRRTVRR
jgi:hypothetical protein